MKKLLIIVTLIIISFSQNFKVWAKEGTELRYFMINGVKCRISGFDIYAIIPEINEKIEIEYEMYPKAQITEKSYAEVSGKIKSFVGYTKNNIVFLFENGKRKTYQIHFNILPFINSWYTSWNKGENLSKISREGYNAVFAYVGKDAPFDEIGSFLNLADFYKLNVILQIKSYDIDHRNYSEILKYIKRFGRHPALLGWYLYDEPQYARIRRKIKLLPRLEKTLEIVRKETPLKPVYICFGMRENIDTYTKEFVNLYDVYMFDNYPCKEEENEFPKQLFLIYTRLLDFSRGFNIKHNKIGYVFVNQGYGNDESGKPHVKKRDPTYNEYRYMIYSNLIRKPVGISNWAFYLSRKKLRENTIYPINKEYMKFLKYIKTGEYLSADIDVKGNSIGYMVGEVKGSKCMIAVNESNESLSASFCGSVLKDISLIKVESEDREITVKNRGFQDSFSPYQVHIYTWKAQNPN